MGNFDNDFIFLFRLVGSFSITVITKALIQKQVLSRLGKDFYFCCKKEYV